MYTNSLLLAEGVLYERRRAVIRKRKVDESITPAALSGFDSNDSSTGAASRLERLRAVPLKFHRFHAVRDRTGLSRSTIWRLERRGAFPKHRQISPNAVGWLEQEIDEWMLDKTAVG